MALSRIKTWIAGEVLTASDLNAEFNNILNNPTSLISPFTSDIDFDGNLLTLDEAAATSVQSTAGSSWDFTSGAKSGTPGTTGSIADWSAQTFTDTATAGSGTATNWVGFAIQRPTLAATNASVTTTNAATLYIPNAPLAGTNETITNAIALWVDDGLTKLDGDATVGGTLGVTGATTLAGVTVSGQITSTHASPFVFEGATANDFETTVAVTDPTADRTITIPDTTGTISLATPIVGSAYKLAIIPHATNPTYQLTYSADNIVVTNSAGVALNVATWSGTLDLTASGVDGLDTGSEAGDTDYFIWAIYDGTNKKFLLSTSSSSPTLPSGYTFSALVGHRRNDGSSNLISAHQYGKRVFYGAKQAVLSGGSAATETAVTITGFVPAIAETFQIEVYGSNGAGLSRNLLIKVVSGSTFFRQVIGASTATDGSSSLLCPNIGRTLYYEFSGGSCTGNIAVQGYSLP